MKKKAKPRRLRVKVIDMTSPKQIKETKRFSREVDRMMEVFARAVR